MLIDQIYRECMDSYSARYDASCAAAADLADKEKALAVLYARRAQMNAWYDMARGEIVLGKRK